jgi:hypothetical protein
MYPSQMYPSRVAEAANIAVGIVRDLPILKKKKKKKKGL